MVGGRITEHVMTEARARRAQGQGWQTIAQVLGVNREDLRGACGPKRREAAPAAPPPKVDQAALTARAARRRAAAAAVVESRAPDMRPIGAGTAGLEILGLLCAATATEAELAAHLGITLVALRPALGRLTARRLIVRVGACSWGATVAGSKVLEISREAARPKLRALSFAERVLLAVADGVGFSRLIADRLKVAVPQASNALAKWHEAHMVEARDATERGSRGAHRRYRWTLSAEGAARVAELKALHPTLGAPTDARD